MAAAAGRHVSRRSGQGYALAALALCLVLSVVVVLALEPAVDDAFIVYRYVDRVLDGHGLTYNDGERVEGFTSLSWTLLLAGISATGIRPHVASVVLNSLLILSSTAPLLWLLHILGIPRPVRLVALGLWATSILYFKVVFLGLEFGLYGLLLLAFVCCGLRGLDYPGLRQSSPLLSVATGVLGGALFATRPESLPVLPLLLLSAHAFDRRRPAIQSHIRHAAVSYLAGVAAVLLWRGSYYGALLPNSVTAKSVSWSTLSSPVELVTIAAAGAAYLYRAYVDNPVFLLALVAALGLLWTRRRVLELALLLIPILWQHVIILENGGDWMRYHRFVNMQTPLMIVCLTVVLHEASRQSARLAASLFVGMLVLHLWTNAQYLQLGAGRLQQAIGTTMDDRWLEGELYDRLGSRLNDRWVRGDVLAAEAIGRVGYAGPAVYIHDPSGLTDRALARDERATRSVYGRTNWQYSSGLGPALVVLHWWARTPELNHESGFNHYCVGPYPPRHDGAWLYVLMRPDRAPYYEPLLADLGIRRVPAARVQTLAGAASQWCPAEFGDIPADGRR
jgi:hypothetical protein